MLRSPLSGATRAEIRLYRAFAKERMRWERRMVSGDLARPVMERPAEWRGLPLPLYDRFELRAIRHLKRRGDWAQIIERWASAHDKQDQTRGLDRRALRREIVQLQRERTPV